MSRENFKSFKGQSLESQVVDIAGKNPNTDIEFIQVSEPISELISDTECGTTDADQTIKNKEKKNVVRSRKSKKKISRIK